MYCFKCMSHLCSCGNGRRKVQPFAATLTDYPAQIASPKDVSGLILWFRADLGTSLTGLTVERWEDQSGTGVANKHLEAFGTPTLIPGDPDYNQKPSIRFNGTTDYFAQPGVWGPQAQPYTVFIVGDAHPQDDFGVFMAPYVANDFMAYSEANYELNHNSFTAFCDNYLWAEGAEVVTTSPHVYCVTCNGASSSLYVDGFQNALITNDIGNGAIGRLSVGYEASGLSGGAPYLTGRIAEIIVFSGALTEAQRGSVMRYLRERYVTPVMAEGTGHYDIGATPPVISSINYTQGDPAGGGASIVITGTGSFDLVSSVDFGGSAATITAQDATSVTVTLPAHASGAVTVTVTNPAGSGTIGFEYWYPGDEASCTGLWERPSYSTTSGYWTPRVTTNRLTEVGTVAEVSGEAGTPEFGAGYLKTTNSAGAEVCLSSFISIASGTIGLVVNCTSETNPEVADATPYGNFSIASKVSSGPIGFYNANSGGTRRFGFFCYDNVSGVYRVTKVTPAASPIGNYHALLGTYTRGGNFSLSVDGSSFAGSSVAFGALGHPLLYSTEGGNPSAPFLIGSTYALDQTWNGSVRAVVFYDANKSDTVATKYHLWAKQRHGAV